jgi:lipopolysaccharide assembly outer membrane protein LptD (OstA)
MKRLIFVIALLACLPVFAQDQSRSAPSIDSTIYRKAGTYRIEATVRIEGVERQVIVTSAGLQWIDHSACLIRLTGNVEVATKGFVLQSDEADYHCSTGEIEPRGNVHMNFVPQQ